MRERSRDHQQMRLKLAGEGPADGTCAPGTFNPEDVSFCDVAVRLCPKLKYAELFARVEQDAERRRKRVRRLQARMRRGAYHVPEDAVAQALLAELDTGWPA
jgi:hypothetical protein